MARIRTAEESFTEAVESGLFGDAPVLVMCSAGRDSHTLLDMAVRRLGAGNVHALHVNYHLREGADGDERNITTRCKELGVPYTVVHAAQQPEQGNTHQWARDLRYEAAADVCEQHSLGRVLVAHTMSDQVETALARLATSHGRKALCGMKDSRQLNETVCLARPLFTLSREDTAAYCDEKGIAYRDDPSNDDEKYTRAKIRNGVVPALKKVNENFEINVVRTLDALSAEGELLEAVVDLELDGLSISQERLRQMKPVLAQLVLRALCERTVGRSCPRVIHRLNEVLSLQKSLNSKYNQYELGNKVRVVLDQNGILTVEEIDN